MEISITYNGELWTYEVDDGICTWFRGPDETIAFSVPRPLDHAQAEEFLRVHNLGYRAGVRDGEARKAAQIRAALDIQL